MRTGRNAALRRLLTGALVLLLLSACTQQPSKGPDDGKPVAGGSLRVAVRDLSTLDPAKATGRGSAFVLEQVFDSLTRIDVAGNVQPAAAASWDVSGDGRTWTFKLAPASFHDGAAVTAYDFKFAFDRAATKANNAEAAFQLEPVSGFKAARIDGSAQGLAGVSVVNQTTLRIQLDYAFYELPYYLAHPSLGPISQKVFNRNPAAFGDTPVGNGPFKVVGARTAGGMALQRFDDHAGSTAYLDSINVTVAADPNEGWRQYLDGTVDIAEIPAPAIESGRGKFGTDGFTPYWAGVYYGPNLRLEKFKKPEMRRAIALAIDRAAIAATVYGGTKSPSDGIIPRGIGGFAGSRCKDCRLNQSEARSLLQTAFGATPPEVIVDHLDASPSREVAAAIAANLRGIGLTVKTRAHTSGAYLQLLQSGRQELSELGWLSDVPTPDGFLAQQLKSGSPNNQVAFADATFDSLLDKARGASSFETRRNLYRQAEERALSQMALIPVVFFRNHVAIAENVQGVFLNGAGIFDAAAAWIKR